MEQILIEQIKKHPNFGNSGTGKIHISKCPGRLSFSKHCDYVNNDLLYLASDFFTYAGVQLILNNSSNETFSGTELKLSRARIKIANLNPDFKNSEIELEKLSDKYIAELKSDWSFYILKILSLLKDYAYIKLDKVLAINIIINSNLKAAAGMSSSHALILSSSYSLIKAFQDNNLLTEQGINFFKILLNTSLPAQSELNNENILPLLKFYQEIEIAKGFNSGLGDQAAQLLAKRNQFCFIKLFPTLNYTYIPIPEHISFMILPSFIKAEKSSAEYQNRVKYFKEYKEVNTLAQEIHSEALYISDLLSYLDDKTILSKIKNKLSTFQCGHVAHLAIYALAEGARLRNLRTNFTIKALAEHLNHSHLAEWVSIKEPAIEKLPFLKNFPANVFKAQEFINPNMAISEHLGAYRASTEFNDALHEFSLNLDGVLGSSIMGAGLGGNNLAVVNTNKAEEIKDKLIKNFYSHYNLSKTAALDISTHTGSSGLEYLGEF